MLPGYHDKAGLHFCARLHSLANLPALAQQKYQDLARYRYLYLVPPPHALDLLHDTPKPKLWLELRRLPAH